MLLVAILSFLFQHLAAKDMIRIARRQCERRGPLWPGTIVPGDGNYLAVGLRGVRVAQVRVLAVAASPGPLARIPELAEPRPDARAERLLRAPTRAQTAQAVASPAFARRLRLSPCIAPSIHDERANERHAVKDSRTARESHLARESPVRCLLATRAAGRVGPGLQQHQISRTALLSSAVHTVCFSTVRNHSFCIACT